MKYATLAALAATAGLSVALAVPTALAISKPKAEAPAATSGLPDACKAGHAMEPAASSPMGHSMDTDEAHTALMAGMGTMNADMMTGAQAQDINVAFVCSMIPHHQGAIDMAKAQLQFGDDPWAREMAQKVIDAQTREIADMIKWLEDHAR